MVKWKDTREVVTISNKHTEPKLVPVTNRRGFEKLKPDSVRDYNRYMSRIDRTDQMLSYHSAMRKTIRWYKKVGVHMMEMFLVNAFYLYNQTKMNICDRVSISVFREMVSTWLVGPLTVDPRDTCVTDFHFLAPLPPTNSKTNPTKQCRVCSKQKKRRESRYACGRCSDRVILCVDPCFRVYHSQLANIENIPVDNTESED